jgi:hypothetical protein
LFARRGGRDTSKFDFCVKDFCVKDLWVKPWRVAVDWLSMLDTAASGHEAAGVAAGIR